MQEVLRLSRAVVFLASWKLHHERAVSQGWMAPEERRQVRSLGAGPLDGLCCVGLVPSFFSALDRLCCWLCFPVLTAVLEVTKYEPLWTEI